MRYYGSVGEGAELETAARVVPQRIYGCLGLAAGNALRDMGTIGAAAELETAAARVVPQRIYGCLGLAAGNALRDTGTIGTAAELE